MECYEDFWQITAAALRFAVRHNGLESYFAEIISVDRVKTYQPSPRVYALGPEILNLPAAEILFVSYKLWDAAGAKAFGYRVCWCNRSGAENGPLGGCSRFYGAPA
jgi:2-haloacid dehalogenase